MSGSVPGQEMCVHNQAKCTDRNIGCMREKVVFDYGTTNLIFKDYKDDKTVCGTSANSVQGVTMGVENRTVALDQIGCGTSTSNMNNNARNLPEKKTVDQREGKELPLIEQAGRTEIK